MTCVIVGASVAGGRAAEALRDRGYEGRVVLVGAEPVRPYERPPLSKGFLTGQVTQDKLYLRSESHYDANGIELKLEARATRLDPVAHQIDLDSGETLAYDKLLIATGSELRRLTVPGANLAGVYYLRTLADSLTLGQELRRAGPVVVIGGGFIGSEVVASARSLGCKVTLVEAATLPLERVLGRALGEILVAIHRDHGVELRLGTGVRELRGDGRVGEVLLADGTVIASDTVVIGVGVTPAVGWLSGSGVAIDNGVVVNEYTETNVPDVYAAGDAANAWNPLVAARLRFEHFENAQDQGLAAGAVMAGVREPYLPVPYFWSDQYEHTYQYVGYALPSDRMVLRGDPRARAFTAFFLRDGKVKAAFAIDRLRDIMAARRLIRYATPVDAARLADEGTDLRALAR